MVVRLLLLIKNHFRTLQEMIEDLLSIVHILSCRLYELRRYKKILRDELKQDN